MAAIIVERKELKSTAFLSTEYRSMYCILLLATFVSGCGSMCGSDQQQKAISPNGKLQAVSYYYD